MGSDEEQIRIELVIQEQLKEVNVTEPSKIEVKSVISEVTTDTVIVSGIKELTQIMGLSSIRESNLTDEQKKLAVQIYEETKVAIQGFINDTSLNNTVKITKTLGQVIKQLESVKGPSGADKKVVAIQLGRILIKEVTPDDKGEAEIIMVYDLVAEPILEAMIEVSRVVNVAIQEITTKCCPGLFELLKRYKSVKKAIK